MLINLTEVLTRDGKRMKTDALLEMKTFESKLGSFPICRKEPVHLEITNTGNRVLHVEGKAELELVIPCDRCLEDVHWTMLLEIEKEIDIKQTSEDRIKALDEHYYIDGYNLDVDKLLYGEILVNWPLHVLCKEDCKGICNVCGVNLNHETCDCESTDLDPRMAKIRDIFSKFKEV